MVKTTKTYEPGKTYKVTLGRAIEWRPGVWLRPGDALTLDGSVCNEIGDAILTIVEV